MEVTVQRLFDWMAAVVGLAIVTVIFTSPQTASVINSFAGLVVGSLQAATDPVS